MRRRSLRVGTLALAFAALASAAVPANPARAAVTLHVPVLMYHHVRPPSLIPSSEQYPDLYVDPKLFDAQMAALKAWHWHTITSAALAKAVKAGTTLPARTIVITFDDGRPDAYTYAFPILKKYGFVATFFIIPSRIGTSTHLSSTQIKALAAAGNEIANHTWSHPDLTGLSYDGVRTEVRRASDSIQSLVGVRPTTLAYPSGRYNSTVMSAVNAEGIYLAFTTAAGAREDQATRLYEPRIRIHGVSRRSDGTFSGGTTSSGLMWLIGPYAPPLVTAPTEQLYAGATLGASTVPIRARWSATDATGISSYGLRVQVNGGLWSTVSLPTAKSTSLVSFLTPGTAYRHRVRATNGAGAVSAYAYGPTIRPWRFQESAAGIAYLGTWSSATSTSYSGGAVRYSTALDASATYTFTGSSFAWVAERGTTRGSAAVYLDGVYQLTVNLYSSTFQPRILVFAANWSTNGTHTIRIRNLGTVGHSRVDLDAVVGFMKI